MYRSKMSKYKSKKSFKRGVNHIHKKNYESSGSKYVMRGGIRL
ncbi:MAG: hypothetical protein [Microvirus sp.]|nr:MAG: hypothetical protein [Microvirus sp.]